MTFIKIPNLIKRDMLPGIKAGFIHTDNMTVAYWRFEPGAQIPPHSHPHEQVTTIIEGEFELTVGDETQIMTSGSAATIKPNLQHSGRAITKTYIIDAFCPVRKDYKET